ncbi:hypothetical protein PgNI_06524 [Pyricularia grisea]|uniref:Uncharacterized protein n=1 Tax=Pyricularia grisea TaxID=148305 RepID=A0A6P8B3P7_PYRGI|nr:hypothetical protein PgNI_06524 [Pyricularia grisea]TLD09870.1 hypothetical protein PgNI_06524 [Pyricularia grisea]
MSSQMHIRIASPYPSSILPLPPTLGLVIDRKHAVERQPHILAFPQRHNQTPSVAVLGAVGRVSVAQHDDALNDDARQARGQRHAHRGAVVVAHL